MICNMKEKHHEMDKINAIYEVECKEHNVKYVGETMRPLKMRAVEHRVLSNKEAKISHTLGWREKKEVEEINEEDKHIRKSSRLEVKERKNYKQMDQGERIIMTEGTTEPAKHAYEYQTEHTEHSMSIKAIGYEPNIRKRQIKEALEIYKRKPQLNEDAGKAKIFPMFRDIVKKEQDEKRKQDQMKREEQKRSKNEKHPGEEQESNENEGVKQCVIPDSELDETIPYIGDQIQSDYEDIDLVIEEGKSEMEN